MRPTRWNTTRALFLAGAIGWLLLPAAGSSAEEPVPPGAAPFSDPLSIDHTYFPVTPGAVKVFTGREHGRNVTVIERHLHEVRTFDWHGLEVACRVVEELQFEDGELVEKDRIYYARDDEGTVWTFGHTEEGEDGGEDEGEGEEEGAEGNGWVVGAVREEDPPEVVESAEPVVAMPAEVSRGATWTSEDVPPHRHSMMTVEDDSTGAGTPAGRFRDCLRVREENLVEGTHDVHWFAPDVGLVKTRARGERLRLNAATMR